MSEVYKKVGRGGAGNYYSKQDIVDATKSADLESQAQTSTSASADTTPQPQSSQPPSSYLHTGRGGAGNWIEPSALTSQGLMQAPSPNPTSTVAPSSKTPAIGSSKPLYRGGRGGAGNYYDPEADKMEAERKKVADEEKARKEVQSAVERDVEGGLSKPERAYGSGAGAWEMGRMGRDEL